MARKFRLGRLLITPGAIEAMRGVSVWSYALRHLNGDWGDLDQEDKLANERALRDGERILSAYNLPSGERIWIITEWDRSATTILLPEEY